MIETIAPAADRDGALITDVATGTGAVAIALARRYPCRVVGIDQSPDMLAGARDRIDAAGLGERIELVEAPAEELPITPGSVDALTHTYLLRYVDDPATVLRTLAAAVRPGGMMASLEFGVPRGAELAAWRAYTRVGLPLAGALAGPAWVHTGRFLGPSIERFWNAYPLDTMLRMWADAGMERIRSRRLSAGGGDQVGGDRRPSRYVHARAFAYDSADLGEGLRRSGVDGGQVEVRRLDLGAAGDVGLGYDDASTARALLKQRQAGEAGRSGKGKDCEDCPDHDVQASPARPAGFRGGD
jgi:demethylmenaquinone methyltransferase/2-methoxy-6-polyprenyl-1,4-benzoquinol methylase